MRFIQRIYNTNFFIKLRSWEYWPFGIVQAPLFFYWFYLSLRERSLLFFSASNPGIVMGGMFGESKYDVQSLLPKEVSPKTVRVKWPATIESVTRHLAEGGFQFPVIFKPDYGERGRMVRRIKSEKDAVDYINEINGDFLMQSFVDLPLEFGVFYVRYPEDRAGKVVSIVGKEMLSVTGDGRRTLLELIINNRRAKLQLKTLQKTFQNRLEEVVPVGDCVELVSIGNHCLGTKFLNANYLITDALSESFDRISKQINGFYFGRFDLRTASVKDLECGKVSIMELNGCGAEPAHIYDPEFSFREAISALFEHWKRIHTISRQNHKRGVHYITLRDGLAIYRRFKLLNT